MTRLPARVPYGADDHEPRADGALDRLAESVVEIRLLRVAARRDVDDAYTVLLAVLDNPLQAALDVLLAYVARLADLDEHDVAVGRNRPEEASRERAVSGRDDRSHH